VARPPFSPGIFASAHNQRFWCSCASEVVTRVAGRTQLFVIPTGGSTMFVEPERRDLSSIPPQSKRWPKALRFQGVVGLQLPIKSERFTELRPLRKTAGSFQQPAGGSAPPERKMQNYETKPPSL
jgi:hypothetical protein